MGFDEFIASRVLIKVEAEPGKSAAITTASATATLRKTTATIILNNIKAAIATICIEIVANNNISIKSNIKIEKRKAAIVKSLLLKPAVKKTLNKYSKSDQQQQLVVLATPKKLAFEEKSYQQQQLCGNNYKSFTKLCRHFWLIFKRTT